MQVSCAYAAERVDVIQHRHPPRVVVVSILRDMITSEDTNDGEFNVAYLIGQQIDLLGATR